MDAAAAARRAGARRQRQSRHRTCISKALEAERPKPAEAERNLFRFKPKPPPPPPPPATAPAAPPPPVPPVRRAPPPLPPIALKFIGLVETTDRSQTARGPERRPGRLIYGKEGDIIEGRYRILRIGAESIELAYLDGRGRQTIRLSGRKRDAGRRRHAATLSGDVMRRFEETVTTSAEGARRRCWRSR